ncbi:hypothetical protein U9M48_024720 [Paspalum notatum var. saurae]|uniref:GDSL esterase/lipase n=1 Tax=Paspalum notatum var. saurae TaxID=547442 RepID=A0AAQ3TTK1_PASNO
MTTGHSVMKDISTSAVLWLVLIVISFQVLGATARHKVQQQKPPAIFVFGDGLLDVGNNNYLNSSEYFGAPLQANHSYYGIDFPNAVATGRFSNGYNMADFIAKALGLGISPPAYLSLATTINMENFNGDDSTQVTIPLLEQVENFAATTDQIKKQLKLGHKLNEDLISKSVFLLSFGTKDLLHVWLLQNAMFKGNQSSVQYLLSSYGVGIKALYDAGARKFAVINVPPIGCAPAGQMPWRRRGYVPGRCDESKNKLAAEFNDGLRRLMASLSSELHGLIYSVGDLYGVANATFAKPSAAGFVDVADACCGGPCDSPPCQNRTQYWFWDYSYPTQQAAMLAAVAFFYGPAQFTVPISFKKLVQKMPAAIFVFGDGLLDVSNNSCLNYSRSPNQANHSYYSIDFPTSKPTGRFSNGYNMVDFIGNGSILFSLLL